jgi:hypothetical protein
MRLLLNLGTAQADSTQVSRIKERVEEKEGIPPAQQRLIYGGKQMYVSPSPDLATESTLPCFAYYSPGHPETSC